MKKRVSIGLFALLFVCAGPPLGKWVNRLRTPTGTITKWETEWRTLDVMPAKSVSQENRRIELLKLMRMRGSDLDRGIRDEGIEDSFAPRNIAIRAWWEWEEMLGL
ncbi:MAG: hypothetical protein KDK97_11585 [Verrucomicrobiales bacterium]|nr:hypothetical protein [Verrucomicrobiales bacterium]MCP5559965.1 hypothetical protein [Verrucomicrobiaceae bacterium]